MVTAAGNTGCGYTYTGGRGGRAIHAMLVHDLAPVLVGMDASRIEACWDTMNWHAHYVGRGGILSFAISAVDIALWDLKCKKAGEPVTTSPFNNEALESHCCTVLPHPYPWKDPSACPLGVAHSATQCVH